MQKIVKHMAGYSSRLADYMECPVKVYRRWPSGAIHDMHVDDNGRFNPNPHPSNPKKVSELDIVLSNTVEIDVLACPQCGEEHEHNAEFDGNVYGKMCKGCNEPFLYKADNKLFNIHDPKLNQ